MNRGNLIANTYDLPQFQPTESTATQQQQPQTKAPDFGAIGPESGVAYVEDTTKNYYDKWAKLKSFAQTMSSAYDIDVTRPSYDDPMSLKANDMYNKALADLQFQGDQLKTSQDQLNKYSQSMRAGQSTMNVDPTQQMLSMVDPREIATSNVESDMVKELNTRASKTYSTDNDVKRAMEVYNAGYDRLTELAKEDPDNSDYWLRQRGMLNKPIKTDKLWAPRSNDKTNKGNAKINAVHNFAKKLANMMSGASKEWRPSREKTEDGRYLMEATGDLTGLKVDGGIISKWLRDPKTGVVYIKRDDGELIETSNNVLGELRELSSKNTRLLSSDDVASYENTDFVSTIMDDMGNVAPQNYVEQEGQDYISASSEMADEDAKNYSNFLTSRPQEIVEEVKKKESNAYKIESGAKITVKHKPVDWTSLNFTEGYALPNITDLSKADKQKLIDAGYTSEEIMAFKGKMDEGQLIDVLDILGVYYTEFRDKNPWKVKTNPKEPSEKNPKPENEDGTDVAVKDNKGFDPTAY